jgi:hypothetical protein
MQHADFQAFRDLMEGVYSFYGKDASKFALDVWWQALKHYDLAALRDALGRHCVNPDNGQFLPRPADVVRMLEGSTIDSAMVAWSKVDRAIQSVGTYATVVFDDPLIHRVIADMGGWAQLGTKAVDEWPFVGKEFQTRYRGYRARKTVGAYPPKLLGRFDQENQQLGFAMQNPVLIGEQDKALGVLRLGSNKPDLVITEHIERVVDSAKRIERKDVA